MRWLLALLTAGACVALGVSAGGRLRAREEALNAWEGAFSRMEGAAEHLSEDLPGMLARGGDLPALKALRERLLADPAASPEELARDLPFGELLTAAERDAARDCLLSLFAPTRDQQLRSLAFTREQWTRFQRDSREKREKNGRLYVTLGWLSGAALFILMC